MPPTSRRKARRSEATRRHATLPSIEDVARINRKILAGDDPSTSGIPPTRFLEHLARIHEGSTMRYGQIINNALQLAYGRKECDCGKGSDRCECLNHTGAAYDTFYIHDEDFTDILEAYMRRAKATGEFKGP
jgi:hypothetical protein